MIRSVYRLKAGSISRLQISQEELPICGSGEVIVAIQAIGLNFADVFAVLGLYSATPKEAFIPGLEYAGEIIAVGKEVEKYQVGDRVMGVTRFGAFASHIITVPGYLVRLPADWSYDDGASYLVQVLTAYYGLIELGNLKMDSTVLIHSAAGGVGYWANRIAKKYGAYTIGTVGNESKRSFCNEEGYNRVIVRNTNRFKEDLQGALGERPMDLVMECIGGKIMKDGFDLLGPMGRMVVYGSAQYARRSDRPFYPALIWKYLRRPKIDPQNMIKLNKGVLAFNLIYLFDHVNVMSRVLTELEDLDLGLPIVGHTYTFDQLPDALRFFQTGGSVGKIVVQINS